MIKGPYKLKKNIFNRKRKLREEDALNAAWLEELRKLLEMSKNAEEFMRPQINAYKNALTNAVELSNTRHNNEVRTEFGTKFGPMTFDPKDLNFNFSDYADAARREVAERERLKEEALRILRESARKNKRIQNADLYGYDEMNIVRHPTPKTTNADEVVDEAYQVAFIPGVSRYQETEPLYGISTLLMPEPFQPGVIEVKSSTTQKKQKPLIKKKNKKTNSQSSSNAEYNDYVNEANQQGVIPVALPIFESTQPFPFRTIEEITGSTNNAQPVKRTTSVADNVSDEYYNKWTQPFYKQLEMGHSR